MTPSGSLPFQCTGPGLDPSISVSQLSFRVAFDRTLSLPSPEQLLSARPCHRPPSPLPPVLSPVNFDSGTVNGFGLVRSFPPSSPCIPPFPPSPLPQPSLIPPLPPQRREHLLMCRSSQLRPLSVSSTCPPPTPGNTSTSLLPPHRLPCRLTVLLLTNSLPCLGDTGRALPSMPTSLALGSA